jgi:hypothetical protein
VIAGVAVTTVFMLLMPFGWAYVVRHRDGAAELASPDATTPDPGPQTH